MATKLENEDVEWVCKSMCSFGDANISRENSNNYCNENNECLIYNLGKRIYETNKDRIQSRECIINLFPTGLNNLKNLERKQNVKYHEENMVSPLFFIKYDKNGNMIK